MSTLPPIPALSVREREALRAALRGSFAEIVGFLVPRVDAPAGIDAELVAALREDEALAAGVGKAILALPLELRRRVLPTAARDPRPAVRRALFHEWTRETLDVPREGSALLAPAEWCELLRAALCDGDARVCAAAAALAFDSGCGGELAAELSLALERARLEADDGLAWRAVLGLGQARDEASLEQLHTIAIGSDTALAAAAVRALAARPDGIALWLAAFADQRDEVRSAALFALARVVERLDPERVAAVEQAALEHEPSSAVRHALAAYRQRHGAGP